MTIREDSQLLEPGSRVTLLRLDMTVVDPAAGMLHFHNHLKEGTIVWQGVSYAPWPFEIEGLGKSSDRPATPTITAANVDQALTAACLQYDDLIGAVLTVKSTMSKYLDAVNFPGGNPTANPGEHYPDEIWYFDRKEHEDYRAVKWALSSALDFNGVNLPGRVIVANQCAWIYRSAECSYAGGPAAKYDDTPTSDPGLDNCSRRVSGCKLRFGANGELPYGSFPAAGMMRS